MSKTVSESVESLLLTPKENKWVVHILGKGKKSLATAVAQVYLALPSDRTHWTKLGTGVVCLVKDKQEKSFFIRMLDIKEKCIVWEQELYKQFKYRAVSRYFQTFFAHDCRAGINFASTDEAALFRAAIMERVNVFKKKRDEMRQRKMAAYQQQQQQMNFQMSQLAMQNPFFRMPFHPQNMQNLLFMQLRSPTLATSQRAQLQAMFNNMPQEAKQAFLLSLSGGQPLMGQPTMSGMLADRNQSNCSTPTTPTQVPNTPTSESQLPVAAADQLQELTADATAHNATPEPHGDEAAPPPPPPPAAAPPPPPPPPTLAPPPPVPTSPHPSARNASARNASTRSQLEAETSCGDRSDLLQSILAGKKLRKVDECSSRRKIPKVESGMRGALARALESRAKVLGDEDSDDDDEWDDDDDDDWSD